MKLLNYLKRNKEKYDPEDYPKWDNLREETVEGTFTTKTIKVVYKDGSEEVMDAEVVDVNQANAKAVDLDLTFSFFDKGKVSTAAGEVQAKRLNEQKRYIDYDEVKKWEIIDETEKRYRATAKVGDKTYLRYPHSSYNETEEDTRLAVNEQIGFEVIDEDGDN